MTALREQYQERFDSALVPVADRLERFTANLFSDEPRIDRISVRAKSVERFVAKAMAEKDGSQKYDDPINQIQDQIGARIITFYLSDAERLASHVERYFRPIECQDVVPDSEWKFGYFGKHFILVLPEDVKVPGIDRAMLPDFFELQIKTLFQHAWSEANHDLGYKPELQLPSDAERRLAFAAAQSWGADRMFDELFRAAELVRNDA